MQATERAPEAAPQPLLKPRDPLMEARNLLRRAARLPFEAANAKAWGQAFTEHMTAARRAMVDHILESERVDSPMNEVARCAPRLRPLVNQHADEHRQILAQVHQLAEDARRLPKPGLWDMVEMSERAKELQMAADRHEHRRADLVFEANYRELGGEAG